MFILKKLVARLFFPMPLCLEILALGLILLWFTKKQKAGKILISVGVCLLGLFSTPPLSNLFLSSLEYEYPAMQDPGTVRRKLDQPLQWIVVLGGGYSSDERVSITCRPSTATLTRLIEGICIYKQLPGSKLVICIGSPSPQDDPAAAMTQLAEALGVDKKDLVFQQGAVDTKEEAGQLHETLGEAPFILVTSASHMPRALAIFNRQGMSPLAAPTDFQVKESNDSYFPFIPTGTQMMHSERAAYEYLGLAWTKLATLR